MSLKEGPPNGERREPEINGSDSSLVGRGERLLRITRIRQIDRNNPAELGVVLEMLRDPLNRDHIEGISARTGFGDLVDYYGNGRDGRVGINSKSEVLGVYDLRGPSSRRAKQGSGPFVELRGGMLNRLCIRTDAQKMGNGACLVADAERRAFTRHGWDNLLAAIVLDLSQMEQLRQAFSEGRVKGQELQRFLNGFRTKDPRGKLFLIKRKWRWAGVASDNVYVESTGQNHDVLLISKPKSQWLAETSQTT